MGQFDSICSVVMCRRTTPAVLAIVLCLAALVAAEKAGAAPATETAQQAPAPQKTPDVSKEAVVFDRFHTRIRMEADGTGTRETTARVRVLADAGVKAMAVLAFTYTAADQQMDIGYVRVIKPDGTIVTTPDYNVQDLPADVTREAPMYSDIHQKHVAVKGLGVGDTLDYQVTLRTVKPEVPGHFWVDYEFEKNAIVLDEQLDLDVPADKPVTVASADAQPAVTTANGRKVYHWGSSNLTRPDPDAQPKSTKSWKPSVQVTTFKNWDEVGAWYQSLQRDQIAVTPAIQAKADALTKGLTNREDKVGAIFNEVALRIHYVGLDFGIGRYQPHAADDVLSNEYGDCKDKHTLLAALLKAEGIEAWPVLISSSHELDPSTPSPAQFDHVITLVQLDGKPLWMDSTEELAPIGTLFATLRDKQALAIPTTKAPYLERTPADLPYVQSTKFEVKAELNEQGVFTGRFDETYHGDLEMILRAAFRAVPQSQWKELVQQFMNSTGFAGEVQAPEVSPVEELATAFHVAFDYSREKYGEWDNHRITPPMPAIGWELAPGVKQTKPADDVDLGSPGDQDYRATVGLPKGWTLFPSSNVDLKEDWAEYHSTYSFKDGVYAAERRLIVKKDKMPLADWDKYLAFRRAIFDDEMRSTPLMNPNSRQIAVSGLPYATESYWQADPVRAKVGEIIQPLKEAMAILAGEPAAKADDVARMAEIAQAKGICEELVAKTEANSLDLEASDAHSLYYGQALAAAWTCLGWAEIEAKEAGAAEIYLRPAWRLSQSKVTGYELARALEAKGDKAEAARYYELAHIGSADPLLGLVLPSDFDFESRIAAGYKQDTGRELNSTALNRGQYTGSLRAELDKEEEMRPFTRASKLTGSGLFAVAFETGKPVKATLLQGDAGFGSMESALAGHAFPQETPTGSKARLLREVRLICTPWAGCDAYLLLPTSLEMPGSVIKITPNAAGKSTTTNTQTIQIKTQP